MTDFVCIGDVTQDNFFFIDEAEVHCDLRTDQCELALKYGEKIPVEEIGQSAGGNGANVAAGLSKLGFSTKLMTIFGGDERGAWIKRKLMEAGVDLESATTEEKRMSNMSGIILFRRERTILTYHSDGEARIGEIPETKWVYISSPAGKDQGTSYEMVKEYKKNHPGVKIAANPPMWDLKTGRNFLKPILEITDVLVLNWEEAETLLGSQKLKVKNQKLQGAKELLAGMAETGAKIVVVTDGPDGAYAFDGETFWHCGSFGVGAVEPTGAGDAFSSGFLAGLIDCGTVTGAMKWGTVNSYSVIQKIGSQAGLLSREEVRIKPGEKTNWDPKQI